MLYFICRFFCYTAFILLYKSDITHIYSFAQLSLANNKKFCFIQIGGVILKNTIQIDGNFFINTICSPSLYIILPNFKRNYLSYSFSAFSNQTYKPKFEYKHDKNDEIFEFCQFCFLKAEIRDF